MTESWPDIAIIVFIVLSIGFILWRGGQANPQGTGSLGKQMQNLDAELRKQAGLQDAKSLQMLQIETRLDSIERTGARIDDIKRLQDQLGSHDRKLDEMVRSTGALQQTVAENKSTSEHTCRQVDRLYDFIVQKGMGA